MSVLVALIAVGVYFCQGCTMDGGQSGWGQQRTAGAPTRQEIYRDTDPNVIGVYKFVSTEPWLSFRGQGASVVDGLKMTVYLVSGNKPKGVFGNGTIAVTMYRLDRDQAGVERPMQIYEWMLPPEVAYPWRSIQPKGMGCGYGLRLHWDEKLNLAGREVAFVVKYIRSDGRVVTSSRLVQRVPEHGGSAYARKPLREITTPAETTPRTGSAERTGPPIGDAAQGRPRHGQQ